MDGNRKRKGFVKGKLMPFYKAVRPPSPNVQYNSNKTMMTSSTYVTAPASQPKQQKVSFVALSPNNTNSRTNNDDDDNNNNTKTMMISREKKLSQLAEKLFGANVVVDESVDVRADSYISSVQERFRLERTSSERMKPLEKPSVDQTTSSL